MDDREVLLRPPRAAAASKIYYGLRLFLHQRRWLLRLSQIVRASVIFGPLRPMLLTHYRDARPKSPIAVDRQTMFRGAPAAHAVLEELRKRGYASLGTLRDEVVDELLDYCASTNRTRYWNPHKDCAALDRLARNALVVEVARQYLGTEPILWLTQLKWTLPSTTAAGLSSADYVEPAQYDTNAFHYDILDWASLTLFIYLTDVNEDCGTHVLVEGTHAAKSVREITSITMTDEVINRKYRGRLRTIVGQRGTAFLEDTSSIHKVAAGTKKRLLLSIDYVVHRAPPPHRDTLHD